METITYENIKVEGIPFQRIKNLSIEHSVNAHGTCHIEGELWQWSAQKIINRVDESFALRITTNAAGQTSRLFYGTIQSIRVEKENDYAILVIDGITSSGRLDTRKESRTFQNKSLTYEKLLNRLLQNRGTVQVTASDKPVGSFVIQYDETDWSFIVRMASRLSVPACINIVSETPQIYIGIPTSGRTILVKGDSFSLAQNGSQRVVSYQYGYLGDTLQLNGKNYRIRSVRASLEDGILSCVYEVGNASSFIVQKVPNTQVSGRMIKGKVKKVEEDRVQVHFYSMDGTYDEESSCWFPYATAYSSKDGSGWYSMPEEDDEVRVFFPSGDEGEAFAAGAIAKHVPENVHDKVWRGVNGKAVLLTAEGLIITCKDQKIFIRLSDENGIEIVSDKNITVTSSANVNVSAGNTIRILAEKEVILGTAESYINIREEGISATGEQIVLV